MSTLKSYRSFGERAFDFANICFLGLLTLTFLIPVLITYSSSVTNETVLLREGYQLFPKDISLFAYDFLIRTNNNFLMTLQNSAVITVIGTVISVLITTTLAYGLSINDLPFRRTFTVLIIFTMYFSGGIIPSYVIYKMLGISNTLTIQIIMYAVNPFYMIMMSNYYRTLPIELVESGRIDGAGEFKIFYSLILPLCKPMIATLIIFYGVMFWNDWVTYTYYCSADSVMPLQVLMQRMMAYADEFLVASNASSAQAMGTIPREGIKMALVVIITLPIILTYPVLQKYFIKGMIVGAIKG